MKFVIFGGTGSLGKSLIKRILSDPVNECHVCSRDEAKHWTLRNEIQNPKLKTYICDVRDKTRVRNVIKQTMPDTVIIASAMKHVDACESHVYESVYTNVIGTFNIVDSVNDLNLAPMSVLHVSTDKACSPINVYGMCKAISERIVTNQNNNNVKFLCVRYGNVLESRGSIIPLFKWQVENKDHITVTDPDMTRFVMTLDNSVDLIMTALKKGQNGSTWIPKLPSMRIGDLAQIFSELYDKPVNVIGIKDGEKIHEDLINESESARTMIVGNYYVINKFGTTYASKESSKKFTYSSKDEVLSKEQLKDHLTKLGVIQLKIEDFVGQRIEEIEDKK